MSTALLAASAASLRFCDCTVTEMIFVPNEVHDGDYLLELQLPRFMNDAAPSRPVLYALLPHE